MINTTIQMVDLKKQYESIKDEVLQAMQDVIHSSAFIQGPQVAQFEKELATYNQAKHVIGCANGTDALQLIMMALDFQPGDEVIVPTFTYVATAEVIALLHLKPVLIDVNPHTFNLDTDQFKKAITSKTVGVVPVHLFGQCADMEAILQIADQHGLQVIEDVAQAIGSVYQLGDKKKYAGTMGIAGATSFFPSKNLGCYGDGGAIFTNEDDLAKKIRMIASHGQSIKYYHDVIGVNSRLDTLQAAILLVKLKRLKTYIEKRQQAALYYDKVFDNHPHIIPPYKEKKSTHVYHQYTVIIKDAHRDDLKKFLESKKVPSMIYYPIPLHLQKAYQTDHYTKGSFPISEMLCNSVLSLPMHTELDEEQLHFISTTVLSYFK